MKAAVLGDNCIDVYERTGKKYPAGNVMDTGGNIQKLGIPVSVISATVIWEMMGFTWEPQAAGKLEKQWQQV